MVQTTEKKLLNSIVDQLAKENPEFLYAEIPLSPSSLELGFRQVTYRVFANAINGMAWWLDRTLGRGGNFETLSYLGPNDLLYNIILLGAVKAGYKMLFPSPRHSTLAHVNLMKLTDCRTMLASETHVPAADMILESHQMQFFQVPRLQELLDQEYPSYPFDKTFEEARNEPLVVLHTSGTTGFPKPVIWTHDWAASFAQQRSLSPPPGFDIADNMLLRKRILSLMPPFHAAHLFASLIFTICCQTIIIYPLSAVTPSPQMIMDCFKHIKIDVLTLVPPHVELIGGNPELLNFLSQNVECLFWAGGDVSLAAGNLISSKVKLFTTCGSTEMGMWPTIRPNGKWISEHWKFMKIHPDEGIQFRHRAADLFEACVIKNAQAEYEQPVFKVFPALKEYATGDLFSSDPSDPQLWQYRGRTDDLQICITGEKFHPTNVEQRLACLPNVQEVLLVLTRRAQAALLVEMKLNVSFDTREQQAKIIADLWPSIEEVNLMCPTYAKISQELILFVPPSKPMPRTAKGSVQRSKTVELYNEELDELYSKTTALLLHS